MSTPTPRTKTFAENYSPLTIESCLAWAEQLETELSKSQAQLAKERSYRDSEIDRIHSELASERQKNEQMAAQLASAREDGARLTDLEKLQGSALVSDDFGHWAVVSSGMQNVPENPPDDIQTAFFIEKSEWKTDVRSAIDSARGVTPPTPAETAPESTEDSETIERLMSERDKALALSVKTSDEALKDVQKIAAERDKLREEVVRIKYVHEQKEIECRRYFSELEIERDKYTGAMINRSAVIAERDSLRQENARLIAEIEELRATIQHLTL